MNKARIALAEAMGWTVEEKDREYRNWDAMPDGRYGRFPHMSVGVPIPDPFTDANDDYAVLEWMRQTKVGTQLSAFLLLERKNQADYSIGDYARAACKVLEI